VQADGTRNVHVSQALDMAGGPIFNGAISTIIGVLMLAFSTSYIFFSFFKVMFLVMVFGPIHSIFLLAVILAYIGPQYKDDANISTFQLDLQNGRLSSSGKTSTGPLPEYPGADERKHQDTYMSSITN
jgi:hypothetical protein